VIRISVFPCALRSILAASILSALPLAAVHADDSADQQADPVMEVTAAATDAELDSSRGAFLPSSINLNDVQQDATDNHNIVIGGTTGSNIINGSFVNTQGLVNVIQNSGNNVVIQSSTIVNLTFSK